MLGITDIDLRQTRFYQEIQAEEREIGLREGLEKGRQREAASVLTRLARHRFGELPVEIERTLASADLERLEAWLDRVVDAPSLTDLFEENAR